MQMKWASVLGSSEEGVEKGLQKMTEMLASNCYPREVIQQARQGASSARTHRRHHEKTVTEGVLTLPYNSEAVAHKVRKAVARSGLEVHIVHSSGPTLRSILTCSALGRLPCHGHKDCLAYQAGLH